MRKTFHNRATAQRGASEILVVLVTSAVTMIVLAVLNQKRIMRLTSLALVTASQTTKGGSSSTLALMTQLFRFRPPTPATEGTYISRCPQNGGFGWPRTCSWLETDPSAVSTNYMHLPSIRLDNYWSSTPTLMNNWSRGDAGARNGASWIVNDTGAAIGLSDGTSLQPQQVAIGVPDLTLRGRTVASFTTMFGNPGGADLFMTGAQPPITYTVANAPVVARNTYAYGGKLTDDSTNALVYPDLISHVDLNVVRTAKGVAMLNQTSHASDSGTIRINLLDQPPPTPATSVGSHTVIWPAAAYQALGAVPPGWWMYVAFNGSGLVDSSWAYPVAQDTNGGAGYQLRGDMIQVNSHPTSSTVAGNQQVFGSWVQVPDVPVTGAGTGYGFGDWRGQYPPGDPFPFRQMQYLYGTNGVMETANYGMAEPVSYNTQQSWPSAFNVGGPQSQQVSTTLDNSQGRGTGIGIIKRPVCTSNSVSTAAPGFANPGDVLPTTMTTLGLVCGIWAWDNYSQTANEGVIAGYAPASFVPSLGACAYGTPLVWQGQMVAPNTGGYTAWYVSGTVNGPGGGDLNCVNNGQTLGVAPMNVALSVTNANTGSTVTSGTINAHYDDNVVVSWSGTFVGQNACTLYTQWGPAWGSTECGMTASGCNNVNATTTWPGINDQNVTYHVECTGINNGYARIYSNYITVKRWCYGAGGPIRVGFIMTNYADAIACRDQIASGAGATCSPDAGTCSVATMSLLECQPYAGTMPAFTNNYSHWCRCNNEASCPMSAPPEGVHVMPAP